MNKELKNHYLQTSMFTNPGPYKNYFLSLTNNINELRDLVCEQHIHKLRLHKMFDEKKIGKNFTWMNCLHDYLNTAVSMTGEIFRLNSHGFIYNKPAEEKIIVTCRYITILFTSVLKAKGIPARCRSGFAPYIYHEHICDHWICEYWSEQNKRWIAIDADIKDLTRCWNQNVNLYDIEKHFEYPAALWLKAREGNIDLNQYQIYRDCDNALQSIAHALFLDFHSIMNYELGYSNIQNFIYGQNFSKLTENDLKVIDDLAKLMQNPDKNFKELRKLWQNEERFRCLRTPYANPYADR